ncbi:MAG: hypothetical protein M3P01_10765 [Actinomycetota bacterium]|nr:hypothetical protein [Actinomycetota bacterium]
MQIQPLRDRLQLIAPSSTEIDRSERRRELVRERALDGVDRAAEGSRLGCAEPELCAPAREASVVRFVARDLDHPVSRAQNQAVVVA